MSKSANHNNNQENRFEDSPTRADGTAVETKPFDLMSIARSAGFHVGEDYDKIQSARLPDESDLMEYSLAGICQFQVVIPKPEPGGFSVVKRSCTFSLRQQNGERLLQQNGEGLLVHGLIPLQGG